VCCSPRRIGKDEWKIENGKLKMTIQEQRPRRCLLRFSFSIFHFQFSILFAFAFLDFLYQCQEF
jgi:hypothetical protein